MTVKLSTGLVTYVMGTGSFKAAFNLGFLDIYSGTQPASADNAPNGTKLATITVDGDGVTGITFGTAVAGYLPKNPSETWSGDGLANGNAGWFRLREASDAGTASSTTAKRVDGSIGNTGADMNVGSVVVTSGAPFIVTGGGFTLPLA